MNWHHRERKNLNGGDKMDLKTISKYLTNLALEKKDEILEYIDKEYKFMDEEDKEKIKELYDKIVNEAFNETSIFCASEENKLRYVFEDDEYEYDLANRKIKHTNLWANASEDIDELEFVVRIIVDMYYAHFD
jgi:hypothetical protein